MTVIAAIAGLLVFGLSPWGQQTVRGAVNRLFFADVRIRQATPDEIKALDEQAGLRVPLLLQLEDLPLDEVIEIPYQEAPNSYFMRTLIRVTTA